MHELPKVDYHLPPDPPARGRIALVGEAPGADEVRQGRPFVGMSGRLLDEGLRAVGVDRGRCFVGNVFRYRPPDNKVAHFFASRGRARKEGRAIDERWGPFGSSDYVLAEFSGELDHLAEVLRDFGPAVVVALGRTPLWALTGQNGIMQLRGQPLPCRLVEGAQVVPTFHPSYVLRGQRAAEPTFREDLAKAKELAEAA